MGTQQLVSVVISFRNEAEVIPELIRRLQNALRPLPVRYELIFVNDVSSDRSLEVLMDERRRDPNIKILTTSRRFGVTPCVLAGFHHARGDAVVYMDCDLQDPPELIPTLIQKWQEGADVVHTTRTRRRGENHFKLWLTRQAYRMINFVSDIEILSETGDFKLISRRALNEILKMNEFDPFMRGLVAWVGFKQVQVFYEREARFAGLTKFSLWRSLNPYKEFIRGLVLFSSLPLYFALFAGLFISACSFIFLFVVILSRAFAAQMPAGWAALMVAFLLLNGTILFTVGILGIYVGRIHRDVKHRPNYILEGWIGFDSDNGKDHEKTT
ncbi:MAG: glycosyltransferase family 2 protein [Lentisphaerota bacterium]